MKMSNEEMKFLMMIAESVDVYLANPAIRDPYKSSIDKRVERILPRLVPTYTFRVSYGNARNPYIMTIRPDIEELSAKANELFTVMNDVNKHSDEYLQTWAEIKTWELSIDPRILTKNHRLCVENGRQFVAILCHELGHVFNEDPLSLVRNYRMAMLRASKFERMMFSKSVIIRKLAMPMFVASESFRVIVEKPEKDKLEMAADAYCPPELRGELMAYIVNHMLTSPAASQMVQTREEYDGDQHTSITYARGTIDLMQKRRDVLRIQIKTQFDSDQNDLYTRKMMSVMGKSLGQYDPSTDKIDLVAESRNLHVFDTEMQVVTETINLMEGIHVSDRKLAMLAVDVDNIVTTDDKLYCLQTVYDYLDAIQNDKDKVVKKMGRNANVTADELLSSDTRYQKLLKLRGEVMAKKVTDEPKSNYGIFVHYPVGYEG